MTDTPLYDATLSDQLLRARLEAQAQVSEARSWALKQAASAQLRADEAKRDYDLKRAELTAQIEERSRATLVHVAPPQPEQCLDLAVEPGAGHEAPERTELDAPPIPSMAELLLPTPGITRFLDALLGAPEG